MDDYREMDKHTHRKEGFIAAWRLAEKKAEAALEFRDDDIEEEFSAWEKGLS